MILQKNKGQRNNKGFTLVELSIVLVIIGLLIGGILAAQSMINTAKVNAFVRQIQQLDVAVANFQSRFRSLPGDSSKFSPAGDENGFVDCSDSDWGDGTSPEVANFFVHLGYTGFMPEVTFTATTSGGVADFVGPTINMPESKLGAKGTVIVGADSYCTFYTNQNLSYTTNHNHYLVINLGSSLYIGDTGNPNALDVVDALAVDTKLDDGKPLDGKVMGTNPASPTGCAAAANDPTTNYDMVTSPRKCDLSIRMLSQVGMN